MAEKYLNQSIKFKCMCNALFEIPVATSNVMINGQKILLSNNFLICTVPGACTFCPLPNGQPGPCFHFGKGPVPITWSDFSNAKLKVNGVRALSDKSKCKCFMGQDISPFGYNKITVSDAVSPISFTLPSIKIETSTIKTDISAVKEFQSFTPNSNLGTKSIINSNNEEIKELKKDNEISLDEKCRYALCNYKNCEKIRECKYINTPHSIKEHISFDGNSELLKQNMITEDFDNYSNDNKEISKMLSPKGENYTIQHHHMISSRQCYDKIPELVKIGNFYKYNINCASNGICLPSGGGYNKTETLDAKISIASKAMDSIGKQWHIGGHSMKLLINSLTKIQVFVENELSKNSTSVITGYDQSVIQLLRLVLMKNKDHYLDSCRLENYEMQQKEFYDIMNRISNRIKLQLVNYNNTPENRKWFYISKMALYYAYEDVLKNYKEQIF